MKKEIKTAKDLREVLLNEVDQFNNGDKNERDVTRMDTFSKIGSTILRTARLELEYAKYKGISVEIPFLTHAQTESAQ